MSTGKLQVRLVRSPISRPAKVQAWVKGLGLKRPNTQVVLPDTPQVRGMLAKVPHMVEVTAVEQKKATRARKPAGAAAKAKSGGHKEAKETQENA